MTQVTLNVLLSFSFEVGNVRDSAAGLAVPIRLTGLKIQRAPAALRG